MSINIIQEYLVSLGFDVDKKSFNEANKALDTLERIISRFKQSFADNAVIKKFADTFNTVLDDLSGKISQFLMSNRGLVIGVIGAIGAAVVALGAIITAATYKFISNMAKADMQIQIFARRMFTTVENARSLKAVMDAMGVSDVDQLKDVAMNPELRAQFMELRKLSAGLALNDNAQQGFRNIRALNFEFTKLNVFMNMFWQNLAGKLGYILEGPLKSLTNWFEGVGNFMSATLPRLGDMFAGIFGILAKIAEVGIKLGTLWTRVPFLGKAINTQLDNMIVLLDVANSILDLINRVIDKVTKLPSFGGKIDPFNSSPSDLYGEQNDSLSVIAVYVRKISDMLTAAWNALMGVFRPIKNWVMKNFGGVVEAVTGGSAQAATSGTSSDIDPAVPSGTSRGHLRKRPGVRVSRTINNFLQSLEERLTDNFDVTSGIAGRSGGSLHPKGRAVDIGLAGKSDSQIVSLMKAVLATPGLKMANLELQPAHYAKIIKQLDRQGVDYRGRVSNQITKDWTGPHLHNSLQAAPQSVSINVHGVHDPRAVANIVKDELDRRTMRTGITGRGSFA